MKTIYRWMDRFTSWLGSPAALVLAVALVVSWLIGGLVGGFSDGYHLVLNSPTTASTFVMVFVVQATTNRESKAVNAKLDVLIDRLDTPNDIVGAEKLTEKEIAALRTRILDTDD